MPVVKLTQELINNELVCPDGQRKAELVDDGRTGLYVSITAKSSGIGTYYWRYKDSNGVTSHHRIAKTDGGLSLDDVKARVADLKFQVSQGVDLKKASKAKKRIPTLNEFFVDDYLPQAKLHQRSFKTTEGIFRRYIKLTLGDMPLDKITLKDVQILHSKVKESGLASATADHVGKQVRAICGAAIRHGVLSVNPAANVKLFNEDNTRNDVLTEAQLSRLLTVLDTHDNQRVCSIIRWLCATGCRSGEALSARWENIHEAEKTWIIPAASNKSRRLRSVPLSDMALKVLSSLDTREERGYLFVNPKTEKPYVTVHRSWCGIRKAAGLPWLRQHSLRHNFASMLINSGRSLYEVQQILGHSDPKVTQRYAHLSTKSLQAAADSASDFMMAALKKAS